MPSVAKKDPRPHFLNRSTLVRNNRALTRSSSRYSDSAHRKGSPIFTTNPSTDQRVAQFSISLRSAPLSTMWSPTKSTPHNPPQPNLGPLFLPSLIPPSVTSSLPPSYTMRPLQRSDYKAGFLDILRVLTSVGEITEKAWNTHYDWISRRDDTYYILVVSDGAGRVVGCGSLIVERKL